MTELAGQTLQNLVALVTGGSQGLGEAIARDLAAKGARVVIGDINENSAKQVAASISYDGSRAFAIPMDVRTKTAFEIARDVITTRWGGSDILINNAALTLRTPFMLLDGSEFDDVLAVNLRGTLFGCQVFGAHLSERGFGRIVNIASRAGQTAGSGAGAHYAASKAGIIVLTKIAATEFATAGVTVNTIAPGPIESKRFANLPKDLRSRLRAQIPVGRFGVASEVAAVVSFLASRQAGYVTGATWDINGGMSMR